MPASTTEGGPPGDRELVARAAAGDRSAFAELYDQHVRPVYWQAYSIVRQDFEAEDVTQDAFITLWRKIDTIMLADDSALPWLLVTARYKALNAQRRMNRRSTQRLSPDTPGAVAVEDEVEASQIRAEIDKAIAVLTPLDRQLYDLCVEGDHTYEMAARELGVTHAVVRNRLSRLRGRLRTDLRSIRETS